MKVARTVLRGLGGSNAPWLPDRPRPATPKLALSQAEGFSWEDFVERNNPVLSEVEGNELVATWGNLGQRPRVLGLC